MSYHDTEDLSYNAFKTIVDIDLQGTFNMTKAAFSLVMREKSGIVINIATPFEHFGVAWQAHAAAAKSGVISLTRSAAVEWSNLGIRVNALSPGGIRDTEGLKKLDESLTEGNEFWITSLFPALLLVFGFVIYLWND